MRALKWIIFLGVLIFIIIIAAQLMTNNDHSPLAPVTVNPNGKYLIKSDGTPFYWIGDTAWDLHHRLTREEITAYLEDRKARGFSIILFRIPMNEKSGAESGNAYGHFPFKNKDIRQPNEEFFALVDYTLDEMEQLGLTAGFLPLWGWVVGNKFGYDVGDEDIEAYGSWLGSRYQDRKNIVWVIGGDSGNSRRWALLAQTLKQADPEKLITYHPGRARISSYHLFGNADWLDFHMTQTGHEPDLETNYTTINEVYRESSKPILNGEPAYEEIRDRIPPHQVRKAAYWSLLAGGVGHTYGHVNIFQFAGSMSDQQDTWGANDNWQNSLGDPGADQMKYLNTLLHSIDWHTYAPDQDLISSDNPFGPTHIRAAVSEDKTKAIIYFPENQQTTLDMSFLNDNGNGVWINPSNGIFQDAGDVPMSGSWRVTPPFSPDALLLLGQEPALSLHFAWNYFFGN